jgi:hypothetical protein
MVESAYPGISVGSMIKSEIRKEIELLGKGVFGEKHGWSMKRA